MLSNQAICSAGFMARLRMNGRDDALMQDRRFDRAQSHTDEIQTSIVSMANPTPRGSADSVAIAPLDRPRPATSCPLTRLTAWTFFGGGGAHPRQLPLT